MTLSEYSLLKMLAIAKMDNHITLLESLKELFREGINSIRRYEQIKTADQLLQVLELRDLLSEDNVSPLKEIAEKLKIRTLLDKIEDYEVNHEPREYLNCYASEKLIKSLSPKDFVLSTPYKSLMSDDRKARIFQTITEQIGTTWRELARNLQIQECVIDEIDFKYGTMATKASQMLKHFDSRADRIKWHYVLCEALDKTHRKQLRMNVQEIMMMNM